ncbi:MAG: hypothetical protein Q8L88_13365 [Bacteroidota bacterium]|nr:hypothetical protein [Bacteroidota bacterium]
MKLSFAVTRNVLLQTLISVLCCIVIGFIRYDIEIFNPYSHRFTIIMFGLYFSLFFFMLKETDITNAIYVLCILFIINEALFRIPAIKENPLLEILCFALYAGAVIIYYRYVYRSRFRTNILSTGLLGMLFMASVMIFRVFLMYFSDRYISYNPLSMLQGSVPDAIAGWGIAIGAYITDRKEVSTWLHLVARK